MVRFLVLVSLFFTLPLYAGKKEDDLQINLSLSKDIVWQREQVIITLEVISKDTLSRLDSETFEQNGFTIIPLEQENVERDNKLHLTLKWIVFPFLADEHVLELPRIRYRPNSGRPITLKLPQKILKVTSLPIYVPPTMPVGKVKLQSDWGNGWLISSKKLYEWNIKADSSHVAPQTLPAISRLLRTSETLQILPLKRELKSISRAPERQRWSEATTTRRANEMSNSGGGVSHNQSYQVPFKALSMGRLDLPEIAVQYFEPESGRLEKVALNKPFVIVVNPWLIYVFAFFMAVLLVLLTIKILPKVQRIFKTRTLKNQALDSLKEAANYQQVREALARYAFAKSWGNNLTLEQFVRRCNGGGFDAVSIRKLVDELRDFEFSFDTDNNRDIKLISESLLIKLR